MPALTVSDAEYRLEIRINNRFSVPTLIIQLPAVIGNPHHEYLLQEAIPWFNAVWAALSVFDVEAEYPTEFSQAFLLALY